MLARKAMRYFEYSLIMAILVKVTGLRSPIRSVVVRVFNKLPVCLITSMIADQIGLHSVLLPINHNFDKFQIYKALFLNQNTRNSEVFLLAAKRKVI